MNMHFVAGEKVEIPEIAFEDELLLSAEQTALVVVDMQNDFVKPGGSLLVAAAIDTVPRIGRLLDRARRRGVRIAYTQDTHVEHDPEWEIWGEHVQAGTWGWEIVDELKPRPEDLVCRKNRYDGFYASWLDHFLSRVWRVRHLVIVGTVSNICVLHTAASAGLRYFHVVLPADCISALTDFDQVLTLRQVSWLYKGSIVRQEAAVRFEQPA